MPWYLIIQITLLILWYTVASMATVSAWIIWLPTIVMLVGLVIVALFFGGFVALAHKFG